MSTIFALDASGKTASVCLVQEDAVLYEELLDRGLTHSETLLPLVQRTFGRAGLSPADVTAYAVTAGPGSFTGLRIGLSLVKGIAFPFETPLLPISTLEAMALATGHTGIVAPAINARRGEVYWAAFRMGEASERIAPDTAGPAAETTEFIQKQSEPVLLVGDGAELCYTKDTYSQNVTVYDTILPVARGAAQAARRDLRLERAVSAASARPVYLRLSQAERERLQLGEMQ